MMSKLDEVEACKQIVALIELFAMCLEVCNRPLTDNLLLLSRLPDSLARMDCL